MSSVHPARRRASYTATVCGVAAGALVAILFGSHSELPRAAEASHRAKPCSRNEEISLRAIATVASELYGSTVHFLPAEPTAERSSPPPTDCSSHS
jgi:hypothetical protein